MLLCAHQPMYLPWRGLFNKIRWADTFCIFDDVPFERHGFGNRNWIKTANGPVLLTVPVRLKDHIDKPIRDILIANETNWQRKHLRSIELAYAKAPFFDKHYPKMQEIYGRKWETLAGLNRVLLEYFLDALGIKVEIVTASEQGFSGSKSELVLDMCLKLGATEYIFGAMGKNYADVEAFEKAGVKVLFQYYHEKPYPQMHGEFVPNLSTIDYLMNVNV